MIDEKKWGKELAICWTRMVGPSRPTISELAIYTKYTRILQSNLNRRLKILILGSTPEFRDWAFKKIWMLLLWIILQNIMKQFLVKSDTNA